MGNVLIGYATRTGAASDVADSVATVLRSAGHRVRIGNLSEDPAVDGADLVIVGSGINTGAWYPEAMAWLRANAEVLSATTVAVYNTSLNAADPAKQDTARGYNDAAILRCAAVASEAFPGRFVPAKVGLLSRIFGRLRGHGSDDHVDHALAEAWAADLQRLLPS